MIRATTSGVMLNYRRNLMNSFISMGNAHNTMLTQRNFNSYAEDPASAAKAFKLRKSRMSVETQYTICDDTFHKYQTAFASLQSMDEVLDTKSSECMKTLSGTTLTWLNDPTGDAREQLTKVLDQMSEMLVQNMNQKYGESFIFAGADGHNVPFEIKDSKLYYRGVPVDAAVPNVRKDNGADVKLANGDYVLASATLVEKPNVDATAPLTDDNGTVFYAEQGATPLNQAAYDALAADDQAKYTKVENAAGATQYYETDQLTSKERYDSIVKSAIKTDGITPDTVTIDGKDYYVVDNDDATMTQDEYDKACADAEKLKYLANEKYFVDIGLGFQENENGQLIESSGFNASLVGINFFGYGQNADGDPKNIYSLVQRMKDLSASVPEGGSWDDVWPEFNRLVGKLETASSNFKTEFTDMAAGTDKLENNLELLEDNYDNLVEQYGNMEDVDMVESITSFIWAQYCYNAALKVGNSVLSQSLMDYLN